MIINISQVSLSSNVCKHTGVVFSYGKVHMVVDLVAVHVIVDSAAVAK